MDESKSFHLPADVHKYLMDHSTQLGDVERGVIADTHALGGISLMQLAPEQGLLLTMLGRILGAREAVEVGTFTGFSAICIAKGLTPDGHLLCCDISDDWTSTASGYWTKAGVADKIELRIGQAISTLRSLPNERYLDLAFIDADKAGYVDYYEELVARLRPGGVLCADNALWFGAVADPSAKDDDTNAIRRFNQRVLDDPRTEVIILPIGDGMTVARRVD